MNKSPRIYIAGHHGMVGSAILRTLKEKGFTNLVTRGRQELDLVNQKEVQKFFQDEKIDEVYLAAAKVGGIHANNTYPAEFIYQNLLIQSNIIHNAFLSGVKKLLFLGSSCIYPKLANQPMKEEELLNGKLELTNEPYAIAKIAGIKMCESYNRQYGKDYGIDYRSIMPTNLYGPGDNYHPENSHVIPALIYRFHEAKINKINSVSIWGTGNPKREFLYVSDLAKASIQIMSLEKGKFNKLTPSRNSHINVGSSIEISIRDLAKLIRDIVGFKGEIFFDTSKPDGALRKIMDSTKIFEMGFEPSVNLSEGLIKTYSDFKKSK
jgi:GDP-L-fucose synthase